MLKVVLTKSVLLMKKKKTSALLPSIIQYLKKNIYWRHSICFLKEVHICFLSRHPQHNWETSSTLQMDPEEGYDNVLQDVTSGRQPASSDQGPSQVQCQVRFYKDLYHISDYLIKIIDAQLCPYRQLTFLSCSGQHRKLKFYLKFANCCLKLLKDYKFVFFKSWKGNLAGQRGSMYP